MEYIGKYKEMAEQFRKDGCDEVMIAEFISREMEEDAFYDSGLEDAIDSEKLWAEFPNDIKDLFLNSALCDKCGVSSFAPGYKIVGSKYSVVIEGKCIKCSEDMVRVCD